MKKKSLKLFNLLIFILVGTFALSGCSSKTASSGDGYSKIKEKGYVVVGLDDTFAPMGFKNEQGEIVGFDVDLAKETFKRLGLEVKFQPIDWSMKETELNTGNIDMIWNGYTITEERKEKVAFSKPYLENKQVIVTMANSNINSKADLKGKKVGTQNSSSSLDAMNTEPDVVKSLDGGEAILFDTNNEAFIDLEAGRIDAVVADEILVRYYIKERGINNYKILDDNFGVQENGVGIRKTDTELLKKVNDTLDEMKKDGTSGKISEKWFGKDIVE
jgi:polar amino acid transport system substrate-binding protein